MIEYFFKDLVILASQKNKAKKRTRRMPKTLENVKNKIGEIILQSKNFEEDIEVLETPFGEILIHDRMLAAI